MSCLDLRLASRWTGGFEVALLSRFYWRWEICGCLRALRIGGSVYETMLRRTLLYQGPRSVELSLIGRKPALGILLSPSPVCLVNMRAISRQISDIFKNVEREIIISKFKAYL